MDEIYQVSDAEARHGEEDFIAHHSDTEDSSQWQDGEQEEEEESMQEGGEV